MLQEKIFLLCDVLHLADCRAVSKAWRCMTDAVLQARGEAAQRSTGLDWSRALSGPVCLLVRALDQHESSMARKVAAAADAAKLKEAYAGISDLTNVDFEEACCSRHALSFLSQIKTCTHKWIFRGNREDYSDEAAYLGFSMLCLACPLKGCMMSSQGRLNDYRQCLETLMTRQRDKVDGAGHSHVVDGSTGDLIECESTSDSGATAVWG